MSHSTTDVISGSVEKDPYFGGLGGKDWNGKRTGFLNPKKEESYSKKVVLC